MLGIGINVHQRATDFPADLVATSLAISGQDVDRLALLGRLTAELDRLEHTDAREDALAESRSRSTLLGKGVEVRAAGRSFAGTATAIDDEGALVVQTASGVERVVTGDVRLA